MKPSGIGGQAVIEGVMMKNKERYAVAVRKPDNEIIVENKEYHSISEKSKLFQLPIIRGVFAFIDSLIIGTSTLTYSASFFEDEEEKEKEKKKEKKEPSKLAEKLIMTGTIMLSIILSVAIFILLPLWISNLLKGPIHSNTLLALLEGIIRLAIFIIYIVAISQMKDIQRVFMYHGAEHKTINCIEHGFELTVENVRTQSREHKRCGTSFLLFVVIISSIFFMFIRVDNLWLKTVVRLLLVPVIAGVSYEIIKFAGRNESKFVEIISKPGLMMQGLTTREPDDSMIEVAIASVEAVFDWRGYLKEELKSQEDVNNINGTSNNNDEVII